MAELKTRPNDADVDAYLDALEPETAASHPELLGRLGRHRVGRSCLYLPRMDQVDLDPLESPV